MDMTSILLREQAGLEHAKLVASGGGQADTDAAKLQDARNTISHYESETLMAKKQASVRTD
jgi:hypothetical protein